MTRTTSETPKTVFENLNNFQFNDIFNLKEVQNLQDLFADAHGVASLITCPDGTPITKPSNFCRLCNDIIRKTEKGRANCILSDITIGKQNFKGPIVRPCLSGGLWDAGASITIGGKHIANWLIGQVRNTDLDEEKLAHYADEIGVDKIEFMKALKEVPVMSVEQFEKISKMLFAFVNQLSEKAYTNLQLNMQIAERTKTDKLLEQNEIELKQNEEKYRTIFENIEDVFFKIDIAGNIIEISPSIKYFTEFNRDELVGNSVSSLYYNFGEREIFLNELLKTGSLRDYELKMVTKNGDIKYVSNNARLIYNIEGNPVFIEGTLRDITRRKLVEEALKISEDKYRTMIEYSNDLIWTLDINGNITFFNEITAKTTGLALEEWIGKSFMPLILAEDRPMIMDAFQKTLKGEASNFELRFKKSDDTMLTIAVNTSPIYISGNVDGLVSFGRDITEDKRAENQLKMLSRAIEQNPVTVVITDKFGNIEYVNPRFTEITGYCLEEVKGKNPRFLQSGTHSQSFYKELWNTILSGNNWFGELHNIKKNGDSFWESAVISPIIDSDGEISYFVAVKEDITEKRKITRDLIKAKERAEESDRLKTAFLNNISHEIRTPFNGLLGFLSIIQDNDITTEERDEYIGIINNSADRLMDTINNIVEMSQIQAGQMNPVLSKTYIRRLISGIYNDNKIEAESKGLKFFLNTDLPHTIEYIFTDGSKLNSILTILIGNALKFTNAGSIEFGVKLGLTSPPTGMIGELAEHYLTSHAESQLEFYVKDTGISIPEGNQESIFEKFMQVDVSNTRQFEGAGLGLSIAKAYVEMLGGNIWVESTEGNGSIFYFTIPYIIEPIEKAVFKKIVINDKTDDEYYPDAELKILIAEDDEGSAKLIALTVKHFAKEVIIVRTGGDAIDACRNNPDIDLVLMDIKMPEMGGYEATRQIRQFNSDVVIIAQTAYALTGDKEKALEAGCNDYIAKPIKKEQLMELVHKYINKIGG